MLFESFGFDAERGESGREVKATFLTESGGQVLRAQSQGNVLALNTVRFYGRDRLVEGADGQIVCTGSPRWITMGLEISGGGAATLIVYHGEVDKANNQRRIGIVKRAHDIHLHLTEGSPSWSSSSPCVEVTKACFIDGPLLVTEASDGAVRVHSVHCAATNTPTNANGKSKSKNKQQAATPMAASVLVAGVHKGRRDIETQDVGKMSPGGLRLTAIRMRGQKGTCYFSALHLCHHFSKLKLQQQGHSSSEEMRSQEDWGGNLKSLHSALTPVVFENEGHMTMRCVAHDISGTSGGVVVLVSCSAGGDLVVREGPVPPTGSTGGVVTASRSLPLPDNVCVSSLLCLQGLVFVGCSQQQQHLLSPHSSQNNNNNNTNTTAAPFMLVFAVDSLAMLCELRGCVKVQEFPSPPSSPLTPHLLCHVLCGQQKQFKTAVISLPGPAGTVVTRLNGSTRRCMAGAAINLPSIILASGKEKKEKKEKKDKKDKEEGAPGGPKKRRLADRAQAFSNAAAAGGTGETQGSSTAMVIASDDDATDINQPAPAVIRALQSRVRLVQEHTDRVKDSTQGLMQSLAGVRRALAHLTTTTVKPSLSSSHAHADAMLMLPGLRGVTDRHSPLLSSPPLKNTATAGVGVSPQHQQPAVVRVVAALALPHAASTSVTMLLRVRNTSALPLFGLSIACACTCPATTTTTTTTASVAAGGGMLSMSTASPLVPVLLPGQEAWLSARAQLTLSMFLAAQSSQGDHSAAVTLVASLIWRGARIPFDASSSLPVAPSASLIEEGKRLAADLPAAWQAVAQGWQPRFAHAQAIRACAASISLEDMHASAVGLSLSSNSSSGSSSPASVLIADGERELARRAAAAHQMRSLGCIIANLPPTSQERLPSWLDLLTTADTTAGSAGSKYRHCWLYSQLAAWAVATDPCPPGSNSSTPVLYYGASKAVDVVLSAGSGGSYYRPDKGSVSGSSSAAAQALLSRSRAVGFVTATSTSPSSSPLSRSDMDKAMEVMLGQLDCLLDHSPDLRPFLPPNAGTGSGTGGCDQACELVLQPIGSSERGPDEAHDMSDDDDDDDGDGDGALMATGSLAAPASCVDPASALSLALATLNHQLGPLNAYSNATATTSDVAIRAVHDTEGALDAARLSATAVLLELKELGLAYRATEARGGGGVEDDHSTTNGSNSIRTARLGQGLGGLSREQQVRCLLARQRADLCAAQALSGGIW